MNNSISTTSAGSPTRWPTDGFAVGPTALLVLAAVAAAVVTGVAGAVVLVLDRASLTHGSSFVTSAITYQLVVEGSVVAVLLAWLPRVSKRSLRELGFFMPNVGQIFAGIGGAVLMFLVVQGAAMLVEALTHQKHEQSVVEMFKHVVGDRSVMLFFAAFAIVIAPFMEETIFRIFIFNVGQRYGGPWIGALVSGVCFGAAHMDIVVFLPLALGGMILSFVYYRSGNAFSSMISHGLFNAITVLMLIFAPHLAG